MVKLSEIVLDERSTMIPVGGIDVRLTYAPQRWSSDFEQKKLATSGYIDILIHMVISWDLETDAGKKLGLNKTAMGKWPKPIWEALALGIAAEIRAGKAFCVNGDDS